MLPKLISLKEAAELVQDGARLALGGNILHRIPSAFVRELARLKKKGLELIKTAGGYDVDLLCAAGCVEAVHAGCVGFENEFGFAPNYRKAVEEGKVKAYENSCYTIITGLRAAAYGVPFLPVAGMWGSDLLEVRDFRTIKDPYSMEEVVAIPRLEPDWAVLHVQECDIYGNARILGTPFEDILMSRAAKGVILTAERIVPTEALVDEPERSQIPGFLVSAVVEVNGGARPGSCYPYYDYDSAQVRDYLALSGDIEKLNEYLNKMI